MGSLIISDTEKKAHLRTEDGRSLAGYVGFLLGNYGYAPHPHKRGDAIEAANSALRDLERHGKLAEDEATAFIFQYELAYRSSQAARRNR